MRTMIWVVTAVAGVFGGGAAATICPSAQIDQVARQLYSELARYEIADLNPIRAAYDFVSAKIQVGTTPEELGFHPSPPLNFTMPDANTWPGVGFGASPGMQNGWTQSVGAQTPQFNYRRLR